MRNQLAQSSQSYANDIYNFVAVPHRLLFSISSFQLLQIDRLYITRQLFSCTEQCLRPSNEHPNKSTFFLSVYFRTAISISSFKLFIALAKTKSLPS